MYNEEEEFKEEDEFKMDDDMIDDPAEENDFDLNDEDPDNNFH
jgi:hypothetical protein